MRTPTKTEKRVVNSFIDWFESLTPEDRMTWLRVMDGVIRGVVQSVK